MLADEPQGLGGACLFPGVGIGRVAIGYEKLELFERWNLAEWQVLEYGSLAHRIVEVLSLCALG